MKFFLPILFFSLLSIASQSQDIELINPVFEESISLGNTVETLLQIKNNTNHSIRLGVQLSDSYHKGDKVSSVCIGEDCFDNFDALELTTLYPNEVLENVKIHFDAGYDELTRELSLTLYDIDNPSSRLTERFRYHIENNFPNGILFANEALQISKIYPNPVSSIASIDYLLNDWSEAATISVHNILGDRILELNLDQTENNLKVPIEQFPNGIYFYTLRLNGKGVTTKKFVVRK